MGIPKPLPRLGDLYVLESNPIEFTTARGSISLIVRKLDPVDMDDARRRAGAASARVRAGKHDRDSLEYLAYLSQALDADPDAVIDLLIGEEVAKRRLSIEAELELGEGDKAGEPTKWGKDGYLQGLVDQWKTLQYAFPDPEHKDHADAKRVFAELSEFSDAVEQRVAEQAKNLRIGKEKLTAEELAHESVGFLMDAGANQAWARELDRCRVWMGTYHAVDTGRVDAGGKAIYERGPRYFPATPEGRDEVDRLPEEVLDRLIKAIAAVSVEVIEGKDSQLTTPSSELSEPFDAVETDASSGLVAANT